MAFPLNKIHKTECNCIECHLDHIKNDEVDVNSTISDFRCCQDEIQEEIEEGKRCQKHPYSYFESKKAREKLGLQNSFCEECNQHTTMEKKQ